VMNALRELGAELTVLIVAHRLSTLEGCDRVVRLRNGRVVDSDTRDSGMGLDGQRR
jgi:ATP-binding cassette subfamily B protein